MRKYRGFGFVDVLISTLLLMICSLLIIYGMNAYYKNLYIIESNQQIDDILRDEIIKTQSKGSYEDSKVGDFSIKYQLLSREDFKGRSLAIVQLEIKDEKNEIQKQYTLVVPSK
ncbi:MAG: hypothetical protein Q4D65_04370 [Peptostreptococcaceae bacterium]|nr:hypothetical protein [Peptostreptococcaceae bacterium]